MYSRTVSPTSLLREQGLEEMTVTALPCLPRPWKQQGDREEEDGEKTEMGEKREKRKEEMECDLRTFLAKGLPLVIDYKTELAFKRELFFHSCVAGATVEGWKG